jgi:lysophospholipase L1-like esterase
MAERPIPSSIFNSEMRSLGGIVIRWAVFGVCFMATIEMASRIDQWWTYRAPIFGLYTYDSALFTTDEYGITGRPNGAYEKWRLNSYGFRGPEIQRAKDSNQLRVVCIGASETFGLYEQPGHEWPRQLEGMLQHSGVHAEVINAAIAGMGLHQRTLHVQNRLLPFSPDVLVFMLEYGSYAGMTEEKLQVWHTQPPGLPTRDGPLDGVKSLRTVSRLKDVFFPRLPVAVQQAIEELERRVRLRAWQRDLGYKFRSIKHLRPLEVDVFKRDLEDLHHISNTAGATVILLAPAMWFNERNLSMTYLSWPFIDESWWREAQGVLSSVAREFAEQEGFDYLDLSELVRGHEQEWMMDMLHFNDDGAKQVAQRVAAKITQRRSAAVPR